MLAEVEGGMSLTRILFGFAYIEDWQADWVGVLKAEVPQRQLCCLPPLSPSVESQSRVYSLWVGPGSGSLPEAFSFAAPYPRSPVMKIC